MAKVSKQLFSKKFYYVNDAGEKFGPYDEVEILEGGRHVRVYKDGNCGMLWFDGLEAVPCEYSYVSEPKHGMYVVSKNGSRGLVDSTGKLVIPVNNREVKVLNKDFAMVDRYTHHFSGKYDDYHYENDHFIVIKDGKYGVIDKDGKEIFPVEYDEIQVGLGGRGLCIKKDGKWGMAFYTGVFVTPCKYEERPYLCGEGLIAIRQNGKYGLIDLSGKQILEPKYAEIKYFSNGGAEVVAFKSAKADGKYCHGMIDKNGNEVVPCKYYSVASLNDGFACVQEGARHELADEKWVYDKAQGKTIGGRSEAIYEENGKIICADLGNTGYYTVMDGVTGDYVARVDRQGLKRFEKKNDKAD